MAVTLPGTGTSMKTTTDGSDQVSHTRVDAITPGTAATNLGKAIDTAAGGTDTGVAALGVRDDALATLTPADGDYAPLRMDSTGALWVRLSAAASLAAGEAHIGEVGGNTAIISATPSLETSAVAAGDIIASTTTLTGAMRVNDGTGILQSITINGKDDVAAGFYIVIFQNTQSLGTGNAAPSISDANADDILAIIPVYASDFIDLGGTRVATIGPDRCGHVLKGTTGGTNLFFGLFAIDGTTYTASGLVFKFGILRD